MKHTAPVIELMRDVVVSADERLVKPDAAIFDICLSRNNVAASETLFVDDKAENCEVAESLQMTAHQSTSAEALRSTLRQYGLPD